MDSFTDPTAEYDACAERNIEASNRGNALAALLSTTEILSKVFGSSKVGYPAKHRILPNDAIKWRDFNVTGMGLNEFTIVRQ